MENVLLLKNQNYLHLQEILEKLKIAVHYGADAVFIGGQELVFVQTQITLH